ncbi:MAG: hypothetical protein IJY79_03070 [Clostridia bacterium]|nr:hypothetical protein [Clostridia bacterium]
MQILYIFGIGTVGEWISTLQDNVVPPFITLIAAGIVVFAALICLLLYTLEYFMLDRKLNLS